MSALAVILPLVFATAHAADGPSPADELADFRQAEAFQAANESRESSAIAGVVGEDETLMEALAATLLNPVASEGSFEADGDDYAYRLKVDWKASGTLVDIIAPLASALGSVPASLAARRRIRARRRVPERDLVHWFQPLP